MNGDISMRRDATTEVPGFRSMGSDLKQGFRPVRFRRGALFEAERAFELHICKASLVDRKRVALERPVLVDAADGESIVLFDQEGTLEKDLAAVSAPVAFTRKQRCLLGNIGLPKVSQEEAANFPRGLSGPVRQLHVRSVFHTVAELKSGNFGPVRR